MDDPKPQKKYHEGPESARRFDNLIRRAYGVSHEEIKRRDEEWKKARSRQNKKAR